MASLDEFIIPYLGLKNGEHRFTYLLDKEFFSHFEKSKIKEAQFDIVVVFDRKDHIVTLDITCSGHLMAPCDRCTVDIAIPMEFEDQVILKLQEAPRETVDEVVYLDPKTSMIDLSPHVYECVHVHLPIQNLKDCEADDYEGCDTDILDLLDNVVEEKDPEEKKQDKGIWGELDKLNLN